MTKTNLRNVRIDDEVWSRAGARARYEGTNLSALIRQWLEDYADAGQARINGQRAPRVRLSAAERAMARRAVQGEAVRIVDAVVDAINRER